MIAPYIVVFAVSAIFVAIASWEGNRSRLVRWLSGSIAIVIVSVFAGIRDFEVGGPDVLLYGNKVFSAMLQTPNLLDITNYARDRGASAEIGYYYLNWVVTRFTADPHVFYTALAALSSTCILIAIMQLRKYGPAVVMWLAYMLTAYVEGFNLLRQSPSLALAVLGIALVLRSRYRMGLVAGAAGLLFHSSAVVFFIMWAVAVYLKTRRGNVTRAVWLVLLVSVLALAAVAPILEFLGSSLGDSKYQEYLAEGARSGRAFGIDALYRAVPIIAGFWALRATRPPKVLAPTRAQRQLLGDEGIRAPELAVGAESKPSEGELGARRAVLVILVLLSLELVLLPIREISYPFYRLLAYFGYLRIIGYGLIVGLSPSYRLAGGLAAVGFSVAYFVLIVLGRNEAFYTSDILTQWLHAR